MIIGEMILSALSRPVNNGDYGEARHDWTMQTALRTLESEFPDLSEMIRDANVVDFGCGTGWQTIALARAGARRVIGVDTNTNTLRHAAQNAREENATNVTFVANVAEIESGSCDVVITQDAMEHFADPEAELAAMARTLRAGGRILLTFGPPWLAPSGSHMHFFTRVPWVNVVFSEKTVLAVRARYRDDAAKRYEDVESGLNRMTVRKFEGIIARSGLEIERLRYRCVRKLDFLQNLPGLREFFINNVSCVLVKV